MPTRADAVPAIRPATPADLPLLLSLIGELAAYERLAHEMSANVESLRESLFGPNPAAHAIIAEFNGQPAGYAVFYRCFSTFRGKPGVYLEDIYVRLALRGRGVGAALLRHVAKAAIAMNGAYLQWVALDWNQPAIEFYGRLGARADTNDWTIFSLSDEALNRLAESNV